MDDLKSKLVSALQNLEMLSRQLRETKDYSKESELTFFLKELVQEQITSESGFKDENSCYPISASR